MPSRKKPSEREAKSSLSRSLQLFDLELSGPDDAAAFHRKISSQVVDLCFETHGPTTVHAEKDNIPKDRNDAIESVFVVELCDYLNERGYILKSTKVHDKLNDMLSSEEDPTTILQWAPFAPHKDSIQLKVTHKRFDAATLNPLNRF
jgi:hypothetical protein